MARVQQNLAWDPLVPVGSTGTKGRPFVSEHQSRLNFRDIYPLPTKPGLKPLSLPMEGAAVGGGGAAVVFVALRRHEMGGWERHGGVF
jgi:hypothetical protein